MYELVKLGECSWYIKGWTNIGIYEKDSENVYIIDTGWDDDYGEEILKTTNAMGWNVLGILNTHAHEDHIGGNKYIQRQVGCPAFCRGSEVAITGCTLIETLVTYGGYPFKEVRDDAWMPEDSWCLDVSDPRFPAEVEVIDIKGHSIGQIGYRLPDGTLFIGDSVASRKTLDRYPLIYSLNVEGYIDNLERMKSLEAEIYLPAHADPLYSVEEFKELVEYNIEKTNELGELLLTFLEEPKDMEEFLKCVFDHFGMKMDYEKYVLILSLLRSYISWFKDNGRVEAQAVDNRFLWRKIK